MMIFKRESRRFLFVSLSSIGLFCSERRAVYSTVPCFVRHTRRRAVDEKRCRTEGRTWSLWLDSETASLGESDWICKVLLLIRRKGDYVCRYTCKVVMSLCLSNPIFSSHCSSPIQVLFFTLSKTFPGDKCVVSLISFLLQDFMQKDYFETFFLPFLPRFNARHSLPTSSDDDLEAFYVSCHLWSWLNLFHLKVYA